MLRLPPLLFKTPHKMTKVKVYQSLIGQIHHTSVKVDGKDVNITFSGADGDNKGTLTTIDEKLQKAIESDPAFNIRFKFVKEYGDSNKGMVGPGQIIQGPLTGDKLSGKGLLVGEDTNKANNTSKPEAESQGSEKEDISGPQDVKEGQEGNSAEGAADSEKGEDINKTDAESTGNAPISENDGEANAEVTGADNADNTGAGDTGRENADKTKKFKTLNEAQEFFCAEPYKVTKSSIRTTSAVIEAGKIYGIEVIFSRE